MLSSSHLPWRRDPGQLASGEAGAVQGTCRGSLNGGFHADRARLTGQRVFPTNPAWQLAIPARRKGRMTMLRLPLTEPPDLTEAHDGAGECREGHMDKGALFKADDQSAVTDHQSEGAFHRQLTEIANECGTDKGTVHGDAHGYTVIYEQLLRPYCDSAINLLEIGLAIGGPEHGQPPERVISSVPSIKMWHEYMPKAKIYGLDISDASAFQTEWFQFFRADAGIKEQLNFVKQRSPRYKIIVDDGSHASFHQQLTLVTLFDCLEPGGLYIIEDLNWTPSIYEKALPKVRKTAALLRNYQSKGSFPVDGPIPSSDWKSVCNEISSVIIYSRKDLSAASALNRSHAATMNTKTSLGRTVRRALRPLAVTLRMKIDDKLAIIQKKG
jgi:hypothetical protein